MEPEYRKLGSKDSIRHYEPCELKLYLQKKLHRSTLSLIKNHLENCVICSDRLGFVQAGQKILIKQRESLIKKQEETGKMGDETLELWDKLSEALKEAEKELQPLLTRPLSCSRGEEGIVLWDWVSSDGLLVGGLRVTEEGRLTLTFFSKELGFEEMSFYSRHGRPNRKRKFLFGSPVKGKVGCFVVFSCPGASRLLMGPSFSLSIE